MSDQNNFIQSLSILYRNTQKYYDRVLAKYDIGYGQLLFLLFIYENEGSTMQDATRITEVDKGTTTKSINRLIDQDYVQTRQDEKDRRVKRLYTTEKAAAIMNSVYEYRNLWRNRLAENTDFESFEAMLDTVRTNSEAADQVKEIDPITSIRIGAMEKLSLSEYPGRAACTVYMAGCNFKCPYCRYRDLVFLPEDYRSLDPQEVLGYLDKRKGILDGVCLNGGEPLIQDEVPLLRRIHELGYPVLLSTNGSNPEALKELVEEGLVDTVAMDVKNTPEKYAATCGMESEGFPLEAVRASVKYLLEGHVNYEFRTTIVQEYHTLEDITAMSGWLKGASKWVLQKYDPTGHLIREGLHACSEEEMEKMRQAAIKNVPACIVRGGKEA
jgi:pyruvate formate lyase activating enzyme